MARVQVAASAELGKEVVKTSTPGAAHIVGERIRSLLARPLTVDTAVQIALLNNRGLQAEYNALGISEAAFVEASLPPGLTFSLERIATATELEIERRVIANILALLTLPRRRAIAETAFREAQYRAVEATFRLAAETRRAYFRAVAAEQVVGFLQQARESVAIAADLTRSLVETGSATQLEHARASVFYAEVSNELAQARLLARTERERLTRLLGLWGSDIDFKLPNRLPGLPRRIQSSPQVEIDAVRRRVDLIAARLELDAAALQLGLTKASRSVSVFQLAGISNYQRVKEQGETEHAHPKGFEIELEIPIFDFGEVGVRRARETYMQAVNRLAELAVNIRSEARSAYQTYRASYDISRQYQNNILPLRQKISEEILLRYNGMLIDVIELLVDTRERIESNLEAIRAKRDFFIAEVDFQTAIIGGGGLGVAGGEQGSVATAAVPAGGH